MNHPNISAYENVENFDSFSKKEFEEYCFFKINDCEKHINFINKNTSSFKNPELLNICEIGSGNSKLLYALERDKLISNALGYEISKSRYNFANKFGELINSKIVKNLNKDFLSDSNPLNSPFDLIIAVDIVFQLITPIDKNQEMKTLKWIRKNLKEKGYLILEIWSLENYIELIEKQDGILRKWESFPIEDPWEFCLAEMSQMKNGDIIWDKTFINRKDPNIKSFFRNIIRPYSRDKMSNLLKSNGFKEIKIFDFWESRDDSVEGEYIILAR